MKVKIMQRQVFYKYAEVEIEVPNDVDVQKYIHDNESLWCDKLYENLSESDYEDGFGMHEGNFTDHTEESEWRYEVNGNGGHL
jgi:hypothetical protein